MALANNNKEVETNTLGARSWSNIAIRESPPGLSLRNGRKTLRGDNP